MIPGLRYAGQARFDTSLGRNDCAPSTRVELLASVYSWIERVCKQHPDDYTGAPLLVDIPSNKSVLWINGLAGTGKSTLAQTIARWCARVFARGHPRSGIIVKISVAGVVLGLGVIEEGLGVDEGPVSRPVSIVSVVIPWL